MNDLVALPRGCKDLRRKISSIYTRGVIIPQDTTRVIASHGLAKAVLYLDGHGHRAQPLWKGSSPDFRSALRAEIAFPALFLSTGLSRGACGRN